MSPHIPTLTPEMPQSLTLNSEQPSTLMQGMTSLTHVENDPPADAVASGDFSQPHEKYWKRYLVSRHPILLAYLASLFVTAFLFVAAVSNSGVHYATDQLSPDENGVAILGEVSEFDWPDPHQLSVTWLIVGCGDYGLQTMDKNTDGSQILLNRAVDVYIDDPSTPAFSYDPTYLPVTKAGRKLRPLGLVSFDTEHRIETGNQYDNLLDQYNFMSFVFVVERATNKSVPITAFAVGDSGPADFTTISVGVQTRSNFTYGAVDGPTTVEAESHTIFATVKHSTRARALTFSMLAINWVLTLCSVIIALVVVRRRGEVKDGVGFMPVTAILSVPTIRGFYVGSPPFGIFLDVVGFFPQMLTVLACAITVLWVFATPQSARDRGTSLENGEAQPDSISSAAV